jgi:hypothetical protein
MSDVSILWKDGKRYVCSGDTMIEVGRVFVLKPEDQNKKKATRKCKECGQDEMYCEECDAYHHVDSWSQEHKEFKDIHDLEAFYEDWGNSSNGWTRIEGDESA